MLRRCLAALRSRNLPLAIQIATGLALGWILIMGLMGLLVLVSCLLAVDCL